MISPRAPVSGPLARRIRDVTVAVDEPVLFMIKGLQVYRGDWGVGGTTIGPDDELAIADVVREIPPRHRTISLCINAFGGSSVSAFNVGRLLRSRFERIVVYVPHVAASAATLLSLCADHIVMSRGAYMTMVDPMLRFGPLLVQASQFIDGHAAAAGAATEHRLVALSSLSLVQEHLTSTLRSAGYDDDARRAIADRLLLTRGCHDAPIARDQLRDVGIRVQSDDECDASIPLRGMERIVQTLVGSKRRAFVRVSTPGNPGRRPS